MFLGLIFPNQAVPVNFSELIRRLRSLRLGLLNLLRKVKILELRTQRQITEASATGSIWLRLAPFGSVWLRGGFHFSDLYGGFYSSFWVHLFFPETNIHARHPAGWFFFRASPTDRRARRASLLPPRSSQVSCNLLESLPDGIGQLMFLEHLDVSGNALVRLPSLSGLKAITRLDCAGNRLKSLPVTLSGCATLRELCCNNNPGLEWLPTDLGLFQPELRGVWCNGCALLELPNSLEAATGLVHLDVGRNRLRRLPDSLGGGQQPNLQTLRCGENAITALPAGLGGAVSLRALDASHNALEEVDVLAACATLVEVRLGDNAIASLPRNLAGGPRRLKAQLKALAHASSSSGGSGSSVKPRVFTGWGDGEWDGLRVFDASGNSLRKIPADLAATLLAGGRTPWRVLLHNNPMQASIRAALGQPDAEDVATLLRYLDALNDELELMDRSESELGDRAREVAAAAVPEPQAPVAVDRAEDVRLERRVREADRGGPVEAVVAAGEERQELLRPHAVQQHLARRVPARERPARRVEATAADRARVVLGRKRVRNSQLWRLVSRSISTRFGSFLDERSSLGANSKRGCFLLGHRFENTHVEETLNHPFPAPARTSSTHAGVAKP